ncbi:MAG: hypothetical protein ABW223_04040 [Rariglobus sp.]
MHKASILLGCCGGRRGLLLLVAWVLSALCSAHSLRAASLVHVKPNAYGVYRIDNDAQARSTGKSVLPRRDVELTTDYKAVMAVSFPNGMNWQIGESARLMLEAFEYEGPSIRNEPRQVRWKSKRDLIDGPGIDLEQSTSSWSATLQSGELALSCLEPEGGSQHVVKTPDARVHLRVISASIRRTATEGTQLHVYDGSAAITLPDGRMLNYGAGTTVNISPKGEVKISKVPPGAWMWMPPVKGARPSLTAAGFPYMPLADQTLLVSPSS